MAKKLIRLTESDLHEIIKQSVSKILKESYNDDDVYMSNYSDAMSDKYESMSVNSILDDIKNEGVDLGDCPGTWMPANWEDVLEEATKIGYDSEMVRKTILEHLNLDIKCAQQSIAAIKRWRG